jgi:hypothetical protein
VKSHGPQVRRERGACRYIRISGSRLSNYFPVGGGARLTSHQKPAVCCRV